MSRLFRDTSPDAERYLLSLLREAPAWRKLVLVDQLNQTARQLALAGLRKRYPEAGPALLRHKLAELVLGRELAERVYGSPPAEG